MMRKFILLIFVVILASSLISATPAIYFSDLIDGPKSGWEGSSTKGAAVTIWGENFGSTRGASYITVNGVQLTADSEYAEWGVTAGNARGMERITFWLNSNMNNGAGTITVTVNGITSNPLNFYVRNTGNIYFVDHNNGNNNYNGRYATFQGGSNGAKKTVSSARSLMSGGNILYMRAGTYTESDPDEAHGAIIYLSTAKSGSSNNYSAFVGYPGEFPVFNRGGTGEGDIFSNMDNNGGKWYWAHHYVLSKFKCITHSGAGGVTFADAASNQRDAYLRIIGLEIDGESLGESTWSGAIALNDLSYTWTYGCNIHNWGYDKFDHAWYLGINSPGSTSTNMLYHYVAWNEIHDFQHRGGENGPSGIYVHPRDTDPPDSYADEVYIHDNLIYNLPAAGILLISRNQNIYIYNNILYNCGMESYRPAVQFNSVWLGQNVRFYNNFVHSREGSSVMTFVDNPKVELKNNIIYSENNVPYFEEGNFGGTHASQYDLWYGNGNPPSWATNALNTNPLFVNPSTNDFHLQSSSPAIDAGSNSVASIVLKDFGGIARPQGSAYDIGAYEYVSSLPIHPADTNQNNIIEMKELIAFIGLWKQGSANVNDVMTALDRWLRGN